MKTALALTLVLLLLTVTVFASQANQLPIATPDITPLDYGDAPDPTYPTLLSSNGARTSDPFQFWLGPLDSLTTLESDANIVDRDEKDDGLVSWTATAGKILIRIRLSRNADSTLGKVYLNLLGDANFDGKWASFTGPGGLLEEWVIQNREVVLVPGQTVAIDTSVPLAFGNLATWIRITVSDTPVDPNQFSTGWDGTGSFALGEVEDYFFSPPDDETPTPTWWPPTPTNTPTSTPTERVIYTTPGGNHDTPTPTDTPKWICTKCGGPTPTFTPYPAPAVTASPSTVRSGGTLSVDGEGFTPNGNVHKEFSCLNGSYTFGFDTQADAQGRVHATLDTTNMPLSSCEVVVMDLTSGRTAIAQFEVK